MADDFHCCPSCYNEGSSCQIISNASPPLYPPATDAISTHARLLPPFPTMGTGENGDAMHWGMPESCWTGQCTILMSYMCRMNQKPSICEAAIENVWPNFLWSSKRNYMFQLKYSYTLLRWANHPIVDGPARSDPPDKYSYIVKH